MEKETLFKAKYIEVSAAVRYWEDAHVNGKADKDGTLIPLRRGDDWAPVIDLDTGRILDWPEGTDAALYYKVCDEGEYWLLDSEKQRIAKWKSHYVPNSILTVDGDFRFEGDYIRFKVGADGFIMNWRRPPLSTAHWTSV